MWSIFKKEINLFFSSLIGYIVIGTFLVVLGLLLWVYPNTNLIDGGFATLDPLFFLAPNIFIFLAPAITMRSFAEEQQTGTIELLVTKPLNDMEIIAGKFFAAWFLLGFALLPTLMYFYTINALGAPVGNLDTGAIIGSYLGLLALGGVFVSIGIFASSLTSNQIVAFILAVFLCFFFHSAFEQLSGLSLFFGNNETIRGLGIQAHYESISRGILDSRDILYFLSLGTLFLALTYGSLSRRKW